VGDGLARLGPVGEPGGVTEIDHRLVGQHAEQLAHGGEAAEARIEDADGTGIVGRGHECGGAACGGSIPDASLVRRGLLAGRSSAINRWALPQSLARVAQPVGGYSRQAARYQIASVVAHPALRERAERARASSATRDFCNSRSSKR